MKQVANWVSGASIALVVGASLAGAQQVMWKDNPITGKVVGLTYGTSGWNAAEAQAVAYGGHLVTIRSASENQWLVDNFSSVWSSQGSGPWLGFSDAAVEGQWRWSSGEPTTYTNWSPGEPNNIGDQDYGRFASAVWDDVGESQLQLRTLLELAQRPPRSWSWPTERPLASGARPYYGTLADIDSDGDLDLVSPDGQVGTVSLWLNDGAGSFTAGQSLAGAGLAVTTIVEDLDSDGKKDIVVTNYNGSLLWSKRQANSFGPWVQLAALPSSGPEGLDSGDFNEDGLLDLVTTSTGNGGSLTRVYLQSAQSGFSSPPLELDGGMVNAQQPTVADIDGDGHEDIVVAYYSSATGIRVFKGNGNGSFTSVSPAFGESGGVKAAVADLDGDGDLDVVTGRLTGNGGVQLWQQTTPLVFSLFQSLDAGPGVHWVEVVDLDGDGVLEITAALPDQNQVRVYRRVASGSFSLDHQLPVFGNTRCVLTGDVNGDGKPDIVANAPTQSNYTVCLNQSIFDCNANGIDDPFDLSSGVATDCNSNGRPDSCDLAFGISQDSDGDGIINECEPTLVSITPSTLPAFVGGTVTVRSTNIANGTVRLDLGGTPLPFTMTDNVGTVTIPPLTAARSSDLTTAATLAFLGPNGPEVTGALAAAFTWDVPEITAAVPATGPYDGPTAVVYTLADNTVTTGIGTATFGNAAPQIAHLFSANGVSKVVTTAPAQANPGPVSVLLRFGAEQTLEERGFVYLGPGIADLSVAEGWQAGGEPLTLSLVDFVPGAPVEVRVGTGVTTGTPSGFLATSTMTVTTPYTATNGVVDVELVQFAGQPNEKRVASPGAWLARAPQVVGATPASAYQGGGETVSLALAGFRPGQAVRVELGSAASGWVTVDATPSGTLDQSSLSFVMPLAPFAGQVDVVAVQDAGGASELRAVAAGAFTVVGASIASLSPVSGPLEGGTTVVVQTSGFQEGVAAQVTLGGATVAGVVTGSGASQTVTFRTVLANASGPSDVNITQGVFNAVLPGGYSFDPARIVRYCTAKLTGQGTLPVIGWTGAPSATTGDFAITLTNALPNKTAQYFYGTSASNFPLFGGFLCAGGGVVRGPLTSTNASSAASAPFPVIAALVGTKRYFQWWFRDPLDPAGSGRGLSAGLEVEFYN